MGSLSRVWSAPPLFPQRGIFLIRAPVLLRSVCSTGGLLHCGRLFWSSHNQNKQRHLWFSDSSSSSCLHACQCLAVYNCFWSDGVAISRVDQQHHWEKKKKKERERNLPPGPKGLRAVGLGCWFCRGVTSVSHAATPSLPLISALRRASSSLCTNLMNSAVAWQRMKVTPMCFKRKPSNRCRSRAQCEHFSGTFMWRSCGELILGWTVIVGREKKNHIFEKKKKYYSKTETKCVFTCMKYIKQVSLHHCVHVTNWFLGSCNGSASSISGSSQLHLRQTCSTGVLHLRRLPWLLARGNMMTELWRH